jgi:hypothetical protein
MKKIRAWLFGRFLPLWAKETLLRENRELKEENERLLFQLAEKDAYISGLQAGIRSLRKIVVNAGEVKK